MKEWGTDLARLDRFLREGKRPISLPASEAGDVVQMLRVYRWLVQEAYGRGAKSMRSASKIVDELSLVGQYPGDLPTALSDIHKLVYKAALFFGRHFDIGGKADLWVCEGKGHAFAKVSELGMRAFELSSVCVVGLDEF